MKAAPALVAALALLATPTHAVEPTAQDGAADAPVHKQPGSNAVPPARAAVMRLLAEPADGLGPPVLVLKGIKAFIKSGRAYEQCGVRGMDAAVDRNIDVLLSELQGITGADAAPAADLLKALGEGNPQPDAVLSDAMAAFRSLRAFYETVTEPLRTAAEEMAEALYHGSSAEQGVIWSNGQVADACAFISGFLAGDRR